MVGVQPKKGRKRELYETVDNEEEYERVEDGGRSLSTNTVVFNVNLTFLANADETFTIGAESSPWRIKFIEAPSTSRSSKHPKLVADIWHTGVVAWLEAKYDLKFNSSHVQPSSGSVTMPNKHGQPRTRIILSCDRSFNYDDQVTTTVCVTEYYPQMEPISVLAKKEFEKSALTDVTLIIGKRKIFATKKYLATHSSYFFNLFFGADSNVNEFHLPKLNYFKLREFLRVILPEAKPVTTKNVDVVLEMAVKLGCPSLVRRCVSVFYYNRETPIYEKLQLADKYDLPEIEEKCLKCLTKVGTLHLVAQHTEKMSDYLKTRIFDQLACLVDRR